MAVKNLPFEKKELKVKVSNPNNLPTVNYHKLSILQGDLKTLSEKNKAKLCKSILTHGYFVPAFVWRSGEDMWILDATQRYHALQELKKQGYDIPEIPYIEIEAKDKKDAAQKLLQITSRYGEVNPETSFFEDFDVDLDYIAEIEIPELDIKLDSFDSTDIIEDEIPEVPEEPVTQVGDLWMCGKHRILCGDATKAEDMGRLMQSKTVDIVFTDPPYGISVIGGSKSFGSIGGSNIVKVNKYPPIQGDDKAFNPAFLLSLSKHLIIFGGNYFANKLPNSRCWLVWDKKGREWNDNFSDCELIWTTFDKPAKIYRHTWMGMVQEGEREERVHPTQKPVGLSIDILKDYSKENDIIADFFLGSGTTLIAAEQLNRICYGMEIEPRYVDVILERYAKLTGNDPVREDGISWVTLKKEH